jgi:UDP-4-amino-4,6-dideoxy-N-acetyl-beta-L-altrosamine transaminase
MIPYGRQSIDDDDIAAVVEVLKGDWVTQGPTVAAFEQAFAEKVGAQHAVAVSSGTSALHLAYLAAGLGPGDEIVTSPITFAATANAARLCGAEVKFADIDPETLCIDVKGIERAITSRTKVISPVDFAGLPCAMNEVNSLSERHGITVVADAAHSLGATYHGKPVGSLADMTCFSFHPVKSITTGEGGLVTTHDPDLAERMKVLRSHGIKPGRDGVTLNDAALDNESGAKNGPGSGTAGWYSEMVELGLNYRITDFQCALGLSQLKKLDLFVSRRSAIAEFYRKAFAQHELIDLQFQPANVTSAWHLFVVKLRLGDMSQTRKDVYNALREAGVGAQIHYIPVHLHPYYRNRYQHRRGDFPVAEHYYYRCLSLPIFPGMTDSEAERVVDTVNRILAAPLRR